MNNKQRLQRDSGRETDEKAFNLSECQHGRETDEKAFNLSECQQAMNQLIQESTNRDHKKPIPVSCCTYHSCLYSMSFLQVIAVPIDLG
jgi:hypothetical protein